jgi:hypothetical protein
MAARSNVLGRNHPDTLTAMAKLGDTYKSQGHYSKAEELQSKVVDARSRMLGGDHPDTVNATAKLDKILMSRSRYEEA